MPFSIGKEVSADILKQYNPPSAELKLKDYQLDYFQYLYSKGEFKKFQSSGVATLYNVPTGKVFFITSWSVNDGIITTAGGLIELFGKGGVFSTESYPFPIIFNQGESIGCNSVGIANIFGFEVETTFLI